MVSHSYRSQSETRVPNLDKCRERGAQARERNTNAAHRHPSRATRPARPAPPGNGGATRRGPGAGGAVQANALTPALYRHIGASRVGLKRAGGPRSHGVLAITSAHRTIWRDV